MEWKLVRNESAGHGLKILTYRAGRFLAEIRTPFHPAGIPASVMFYRSHIHKNAGHPDRILVKTTVAGEAEFRKALVRVMGETADAAWLGGQAVHHG